MSVSTNQDEPKGNRVSQLAATTGVNGTGALNDVCNELANKVKEFVETDVESDILRATQKQTRIALEVIEDALRRYSLQEISLSYNGGKDCLVLLVLFLAALSTTSHSLPPTIQSVYIVSEHPFEEVDDFVDATSATYHLDLARYAVGMKEGFRKYLDDKKVEGKNVKAIFVGTRRTDPHGGSLTHFDMTDKGWPSFMRIHPVIDWHYAEIWAFIRHLGIPYCSLYDRGYTSLGGTTDTHPNPALVQGEKELGQKTFRPAYELIEDDAERLGRDW